MEAAAQDLSILLALPEYVLTRPYVPTESSKLAFLQTTPS